MKEHPEYKGYFITENGKVFSNKRGKIRELKQSLNNKGYLYVSVQVDVKIGKHKKVHRLVAETYIPNPDPDNLIQVDHIDGNKTNNSISNLQWIDCQGNIEKSQCKYIWIIETPNKEIIKVYNFNKFCRDNKLFRSGLQRTEPNKKNYLSHYKKYKILKRIKFK